MNMTTTESRIHVTLDGTDVTVAAAIAAEAREAAERMRKRVKIGRTIDPRAYELRVYFEDADALETRLGRFAKPSERIDFERCVIIYLTAQPTRTE